MKETTNLQEFTKLWCNLERLTEVSNDLGVACIGDLDVKLSAARLK